MWLDEGRFDLLTNQRRLTPPSSAARIDQLIEARAWNDAALALVELELPAWKLRRLVYEDGEWPARFSDSRIYLWHSTTLQPQVTKCCH